MSDAKRFFLGFFLICVFSMGMHIFLVKKGVFNTKHFNTERISGAVVSDGVGQESELLRVEGKVYAVGTDRFYLQTEAKKHLIFESQSLPPVGSKVIVFYKRRGSSCKVVEIRNHRTGW